MRRSRGAWVVAVLVAAAAAACSHGDDGFSPEGDEGGAPHYEGGASDATQPGTGDGASAAETGAHAEGGGGGGEGGIGAPEAGSDEATGHEASAGEEAGSDAGSGDGGEPGAESGADAHAEAGGEQEASTAESGSEGGSDASVGDASDGAAEAALEASTGSVDARQDASSILAPTCDGVIGAGEYGGAGNQAASSSGQTWYMTWDAQNLYVAVAGANIDEGSILYVAIDPSHTGWPAGGSTAGELYDSTDVTTLPFPAVLAVYAHDGYTESRVAAGGAWGAANTTSVTLCDNGTTQVREEVIPWSLVGGRPHAFGWTGYLAANGNANPQGYIYGQMPTDDPSGGPANDDTFAKYFRVSDAEAVPTMPFADEP
jgi:hypothetical protein